MGSGCDFKLFACLKIALVVCSCNYVSAQELDLPISSDSTLANVLSNAARDADLPKSIVEFLGHPEKSFTAFPFDLGTGNLEHDIVIIRENSRSNCSDFGCVHTILEMNGDRILQAFIFVPGPEGVSRVYAREPSVVCVQYGGEFCFDTFGGE